MNPYHRELREVAKRLELPQPTRARVLLELAADLADLEAELVSAGLTLAEARARAIRTLVPSPDAVNDLLTIHRPFYARLVDRFSDPARHRLERVGLVAATVALFALGLSHLVGAGLLTTPAPLTVPVLLVGLAIACLSVWKLFALYVKREHDLLALERGLWLLPLAAVAAAALAGAGLAFDLHAVAARLEADLAGQSMVLVRWLRRDMGLLSLALLTTLAALGMWLFLSAGVAKVRQAEAAVLAGLNYVAQPANEDTERS